MKKQKNLLILVALCLSTFLLLTACSQPNGENNEVTKENVTANEEEKEETNEAEEENNEKEKEVAGENGTPTEITQDELKEGDEGVGPVTIKTELVDFQIPEGLEYRVDYNAINEGRGGVQLDLGGGNDASAEVSTTRPIESQEDALKECMRTNDHLKDGFEVLDDVTIGGLDFKVLHIDYQENYTILRTYYVNYHKNDAGANVYLELMSDEGNDGLSFDDPKYIEFIEGITLK